MTQAIRVPDIGDFDAVEVIDVLIKPGDNVDLEQPLIVLESDKATMEVPADAAGVVAAVNIKVGAKIKQGDVICTLKAGVQPATADAAPRAPAAEQPRQTAAQPAAAAPSPTAASAAYDTQLLVLGGGPGGYTAAFRAADLGLAVTLVERGPNLGGVCLNVGCIPSKALLHAAKVIEDAQAMTAHGVSFGAPKIDLDALRQFKAGVVGKLTGGLVALAKRRKVNVVYGTGRFVSGHQLEVADAQGNTQSISFAQAIIAAGSESVALPFLPQDDPRVWDSSRALELPEIPPRLLVIGGGVIGLEMANVYAALGSQVDVVEMTPALLPGADADLVKVLAKRMQARLENIWTSTKVTAVKAAKKGLTVSFEGQDAPATQTYNAVLVVVGRRPNGGAINAQAAGIQVADNGFIPVNGQQRSNVPHIFAIGDIAGQPMLAHKATHEAKVAAETAAGEKAIFDARCIPSVVYTDPEVAWTGMTENQAKAQGVKVKLGRFPWAANGRSLGMDNSEGFTKLLFDEATGRLLGGAAVGPNAGELMAEISLAVEMGADAHDIGLTIHAHPTLSETVAMAAEQAAGTLTDL